MGVGRCPSGSGLKPDGTSHEKAGEGMGTGAGLRRPTHLSKPQTRPQAQCGPSSQTSSVTSSYSPTSRPKSPANTPSRRLTLFFSTEKVAEQPVQLPEKQRQQLSFDPAQALQLLPSPDSSKWGHSGRQPSPDSLAGSRVQSPDPEPEGGIQTKKEKPKATENRCPRLYTAAAPAPTWGLETPHL